MSHDMTHRTFGTDDITCRYECADPISKLFFSKKKILLLVQSIIFGEKSRDLMSYGSLNRIFSIFRIKSVQNELVVSLSNKFWKLDDVILNR
jgi:hypothetical protein